ncbi:MAG: hypothetical protein IPM54_42705 [Polyangiaceae bacterium]|nr:hypothetical protein [Polyangiaceae bacterium]
MRASSVSVVCRSSMAAQANGRVKQNELEPFGVRPTADALQPLDASC